MKYLLFGTGDYYNRYKKWFGHEEVLALLDNSEKKQHTFIDGLEVLPPEEGVKLNYDVIIILSFYVNQMKEQLISLGVDGGKICHFYGLNRLLGKDRIKRPITYFPDAEAIPMSDTGLKILLMSHDMTLGGPAIALFHAAVVLKKRGYSVVYSSMTDGPMRGMLTENDIPVIVDENLQVATMGDTEWVKKFSLVICNTLNFHIFLSERDTSPPVIWWLHDARFFYDGVDREVIGKISMENLTVVSVGPVPAAAVKEFMPDMGCGELLYGVADMGHGMGKKDSVEAVRFTTIGFLEDIKGQDLLVQAVRALPDDARRGCEFYIVGHNRTLFGERIQDENSELDEIIFTGSVDREGIHRLLDSSDVLICPSRQDSMPTVAAEAMMHCVPCIVSDVTGTAAYIHDGEDGFVFMSGDAVALAEKIKWCVENRNMLADMGQQARKLYERHFSMEVFENSFLQIIENALEDAWQGAGLSER